MDIGRLRQETAQDHREVEAGLPLMLTSLNRTQYTDCLQRMFGVVSAWEDDSAAYAPHWLQDGLAARRRRTLLRQDLAWFDITPPQARPALQHWEDEASFLGAMYVMEGSTLGGQFIARHVEATLDLQRGFGNAYFVGHGDRTGSMWKGFCEDLASKIPDCNTDFAVQGARAMFKTYGLWMQGRLTSNGN